MLLPLKKGKKIKRVYIIYYIWQIPRKVVIINYMDRNLLLNILFLKRSSRSYFCTSILYSHCSLCDLRIKSCINCANFVKISKIRRRPTTISRFFFATCIILIFYSVNLAMISLNNYAKSPLLRLENLGNLLKKICKHYQLTEGGMGDSNEAED
jgi:hypothetical protein